MKKTSNFLSRMLLIVAFFGFAGTVSAQSVLSAGGSSSDNFSCVIGEALVDSKAGFLASLFASDEIADGVKTFYSQNDVQLQSNGNGKVTVTLPETLLAEGAYYSVFDAKGALLGKSDITDSSTTIDTSVYMKGQTVIVLIGTRKTGKLTSVKLLK